MFILVCGWILQYKTLLSLDTKSSHTLTLMNIIKSHTIFWKSNNKDNEYILSAVLYVLTNTNNTHCHYIQCIYYVWLQLIVYQLNSWHGPGISPDLSFIIWQAIAVILHLQLHGGGGGGGFSLRKWKHFCYDTYYD